MTQSGALLVLNNDQILGESVRCVLDFTNNSSST